MQYKIKSYLANRMGNLYFFYQKFGNRFFILLIFSFFVVLLDSVGIAMFVPLLQLVDGLQVGEGGTGKLLALLQRFFSFLHLPFNIMSLLAFIVVLFCAKAIFSYFVQVFQNFVQNRFIQQLQEKNAIKLSNLDYRAFIMSDVGRLQNSLTGDATLVSVAASNYIDTIKNIIVAGVYLAFAVVMDWKFSLFLILTGVILSLLYRYLFQKIKQLSRENNRLVHSYSGLIIQSVQNFKYLKATFRNQFFNKLIVGTLDDTLKNKNKAVKINALGTAVREPFILAVLCTLIGVQVIVFHSTVTSVLVVLVLAYRAMQYMVVVQSSWGAFLSNIGSVENMRDFEEYLDRNKEKLQGSERLDKIGDIEIQDVYLSYDGVDILKKVSLSISDKESVALVGESGSGKTTLVNMVCGLVLPDKGSIGVNGKTLGAVAVDSYRSRIGYVTQEPTVFNADIFDNITFWDERNDVNKQKFDAVVQKTQLVTLLQSLPDGAHTQLGNNGLNLSGGQKQRVSIARELYRDIDLLILDEATSALDSAIEREIKDSIDRLKGELTVITIAHRLSTVRHVDRIFLMSKGEVIDQGSFEELLGRSDEFRKLAALQGIYS